MATERRRDRHCLIIMSVGGVVALAAGLFYGISFQSDESDVGLPFMVYVLRL